MSPYDDIVDHHCHGVVLDDLDRTGFEALMNEAAGPSAPETSPFDSMLGLAVRRHCAPVLDLDPLASPEAYLDRRAELGGVEVATRMLAAAGIGTFLVDTGIGSGRVTPPDRLAALGGGTAREVVRLERLAEQLLADGVPTGDLPDVLTGRLHAMAETGAVGTKSIAAYRVGLDLPAAKPGDAALRDALAGADHARLADRTISGWLAHIALEAGLPLQLHVGYGDRDLDLLACDPLHLTPFLRATEAFGVPVLLLHSYPFHRHSAYLAQVFQHVFMDLGLATHNTGALSSGLVRETLELVPFGKLLFSTDAYGLAEHYLLGSVLFRSALDGVLGALVAAGDLTDADAARITRLVLADNARSVYAL